MFGIPGDTAFWMIFCLLVGLAPLVHWLVVHARRD